jgi:hypothetical protein
MFDLDINRAFAFRKYCQHIDKIGTIEEAQEVAKKFLLLYLAQQQTINNMNLPILENDPLH